MVIRKIYRSLKLSIEGDQITLYPVKTVRKFPDMEDLPEGKLGPDWLGKEERVNRDKRPGIRAILPGEALRKIRR